MHETKADRTKRRNKSTIIIRDFNISFSMIIRTLENSIQPVCPVSYGTLQPTAAV